MTWDRVPNNNIYFVLCIIKPVLASTAIASINRQKKSDSCDVAVRKLRAQMRPIKVPTQTGTIQTHVTNQTSQTRKTPNEIVRPMQRTCANVRRRDGGWAGVHPTVCAVSERENNTQRTVRTRPAGERAPPRQHHDGRLLSGPS